MPADKRSFFQSAVSNENIAFISGFIVGIHTSRGLQNIENPLLSWSFWLSCIAYFTTSLRMHPTERARLHGNCILGMFVGGLAAMNFHSLVRSENNVNPEQQSPRSPRGF